MGRPKARYRRVCLVCKSTKPRSERRPHKARGMCDSHYRAWLRTLPVCKENGCQVRLGLAPQDSRNGYCRWHDHLLLKEPRRTGRAVNSTLEGFVSKIEGCPVEGCWIWKGRYTGRYGVISIQGQDWLAHRFSFGYFLGGHRPGLTLDHICRRSGCVRPDHLMPMTLLSNTRKERDGREWTPYDTAEALLLIPEMPVAVTEWAEKKGLPIGRAEPGQPFGFGLDGQEIVRQSVTKYPTIRALSRV